jgi:hypothetical protein
MLMTGCLNSLMENIELIAVDALLTRAFALKSL